MSVLRGILCIFWWLVPISGRQTVFRNAGPEKGPIVPVNELARSLKEATTCDWEQIGNDLEGDAPWDQFHAVAISGDGSTVVVGGPGGLFSSLDNPGYAKIFRVDERSNSTGALVQIGSLEGEAEQDLFGAVVALNFDGTIVAVSGPDNSNANGDLAGHVRVFSYDEESSEWPQIGQDIDGETSEDFSGGSIALDHTGTILAVGATYNDGIDAVNETDSQRGHVRVYELVDDSWIQMGQDLDGDEPQDQFGWDISLSADGLTLAVGAVFCDANQSKVDTGCVMVFSFNEDSNWIQVGNSIVGEEGGNWEGNTVSLNANGTVVALGAVLSNSNGLYSGQARVFQYKEDEWKQLGSTISGEAAGDQFGQSVSLSADGETLAVGSLRNDGKHGVDSGHVRVFQLNQRVWVQVGRDVDGQAGEDMFGVSVGISADGRRLIAGSLLHDGLNGIDTGNARVFRLQSSCPPWRMATSESIQLQLLGGSPLSFQDISVFESITKQWYEDFFSGDRTIDAVGVRKLTTNVTYLSQVTTVTNTTSINTVIYDQTFAYIDVANIYSPEELLLLPFGNAALRGLYRSMFSAANSTVLEGVTFESPVLSTAAPTNAPTNTPTSKVIPSDGSRSLSVGQVVGIAIGALVFGCIVVVIVWRCHQEKKPTPIAEDLPVGQLIDIDTTPLPQDTGATSMQVLATAAVLNSEFPSLPEFKDQVAAHVSECTTSSSKGQNSKPVTLDSDQVEHEIAAQAEHILPNTVRGVLPRDPSAASDNLTATQSGSYDALLFSRSPMMDESWPPHDHEVSDSNNSEENSSDEAAGQVTALAAEDQHDNTIVPPGMCSC